jgi:hypothetical protein
LLALKSATSLLNLTSKAHHWWAFSFADNRYVYASAIAAFIDGGDPAAAYSREPDCQQGWHGKRLNLGAYGNTPWATMTVYPGGMVILR